MQEVGQSTRTSNGPVAGQIRCARHRTSNEFQIEIIAGDSATCESQIRGTEGCLKKIDLHIHTVATRSDSPFTFSLDTFKRYVNEARLHAVAVTNHDVFDGVQFRSIAQALDIPVFPGIEINVANGHVLLIACPSELEDFEAKGKLVEKRIAKLHDSMSIDELEHIYGDLSRYLIIPHSDKAPQIVGAALERLRPYASAGEVDSPKKFVRALKDSSKLPPVLFSDARMGVGLGKLSPRQTYIDCGTVTLGSLKGTLRDKAKVALSEGDGNNLWQVFDNGQKLSTGLNVILGARSSGKTHTLDAIHDTQENSKYIRQFSLVQHDPQGDEREFKGNVERRKSALVDEHLSGFKRVVEEIVNVDLLANDKEVERYVETLLKSAEDIDRQDAFSQAALFDEVAYDISSTDTLQKLIQSVRQIIENLEFREVIEKHVQVTALKNLALELIRLLHTTTLENSKRKFVNGLVKEIRQGLSIRSSAVLVEDVDLFRVSLDSRRVQRFEDIVGFLKKDAVVFEDTLQGFRIEARREPFVNASEVKAVAGVKTSLVDAFKRYDQPYAYLLQLRDNESLPRAELHKLFVKISYKVLNQDGVEVSGGERSEFRLLQEIADAQKHDILLIDEPESSFDNLFLHSDVNRLLKAISESMPVVIVTHNSTVGASVGADYVLFASKEIQDGKPVYRVYSGHPTDEELHSLDGKSVKSHDVLMSALEAGVAAYESRRKGYEALKGKSRPRRVFGRLR